MTKSLKTDGGDKMFGDAKREKEGREKKRGQRKWDLWMSNSGDLWKIVNNYDAYICSWMVINNTGIFLELSNPDFSNVSVELCKVNKRIQDHYSRN